MTSTPETAAADTFADALADAAGRPAWLRAIERGLIDDAWIGHSEPLTREDVTLIANAAGAALSAAGFTVVSGGEGLQHGDALERDVWDLFDSSGNAFVSPRWRRAAGATAPETTPAEDEWSSAEELIASLLHAFIDESTDPRPDVVTLDEIAATIAASLVDNGFAGSGVAETTP